MRKGMKRIISAVCGASLVMTAITAGAQTLIDYDAASRALDIKGIINDGKSNFVTFSVFKSTVDISSVTENSSELDNAVYKTIKLAEDGSFEAAIILPDDFENGEYALRTYGSELDSTNYFNYIADISVVDSTALGKVNSAATVAEMLTALKAVGIFEQAYLSNYGDKIGSYVLSNKPDGGYTVNSLTDVYYNAVVLARIEGGELSLEQGLLQYSAYVDVDYDTQYAALTDAHRESLGSLFALSHGLSGSFADIYDNLKATAYLKSAASFEDLQSKFLSEATANGISLTSYNALSSEYKRDQAFIELYEAISGAKNLSDVKNLFDTEVSNQAQSGSGSSSGGSTGSSGGSGGVSGGAATYIPTTPVAQTVFADTTGHWAESYIKTLKEKGVINGFEDGTFRPDSTVTRAELVKMLTAILGVPGGSGNSFNDVTAGNWYYAPVYGAYNKGIVNGTSDELFSPNASVTRQDAAVMIFRAWALDAEGNVTFADSADIADYAVEAVAGLADKGIINGYSDNTFRPRASLTRGETAAILSRIIQSN
ncbi:MAG: S-layer homology domain-containing protein [Clostridia bacterium]|nr:S-layer homology domain-containing protein [Clostridia bacterium]